VVGQQGWNWDAKCGKGYWPGDLYIGKEPPVQVDTSAEVEQARNSFRKSLRLSSLSNLPEELRQGNRFVAWHEDVRAGKQTKSPIDPRTGKPAKLDDPATWRTYDEATAYFGSHPEAQGIGRMFDGADRILGIDLVGCRDPLTGDNTPSVWRWLKRLDSYTEVSPSGTGYKVWVRATHDLGGQSKRRNEALGIGISRGDDYFPLTGDRLPWLPGTVNERQEALEALYEAAFDEGRPGIVKAQPTSSGEDTVAE
jgi:primase-polymerase (primpol)-like protein